MNPANTTVILTQKHIEPCSACRSPAILRRHAKDKDFSSYQVHCVSSHFIPTKHRKICKHGDFVIPDHSATQREAVNYWNEMHDLTKSKEK